VHARRRVGINSHSPGPVFYTAGPFGINRRAPSAAAMHAPGAADRCGASFNAGCRFRRSTSSAPCVRCRSAGRSGAYTATRGITRSRPLPAQDALDEVPAVHQTCCAGDMTLIGPRPERPFFIRNLQSRSANY
jgi:hypothetical protein